MWAEFANNRLLMTFDPTGYNRKKNAAKHFKRGQNQVMQPKISEEKPAGGDVSGAECCVAGVVMQGIRY
jgi:hypothetical protein